MADKVEKRVEELFLAGKTRQEIWRELRKTEEPAKVLFYANNIAPPSQRRKYQLHNLFLALLLLFLTTKKLLAALSFGQFDVWLMLMLIVPVINIYVLREILRFRRIGYRFLVVLSFLALVQPENHFAQEASMLIVMIFLTLFLYRKLFPASEQLDVAIS